MRLLPFASLVPLAASTGILVPLYVYPSAQYGDNASNWQPLLDTVRSHPGDLFHVVVNPDSGPGGPGAGKDDPNYVAGVTLLNAEPNVRTLGYVHTDYGFYATSDVVANVTAWSNWASPIGVQGIFFDETPNGQGRVPDEVAYMRDVASGTRLAGFPSPDNALVFNVGQKVIPANTADYFSVADIVIVFENTWAAYQGANPLRDNVPVGFANKSHIMVHTFTSDDETLDVEISRIQEAGINSTWWTTTDYSTYTADPANVQNLADLLRTY